MQSERSLIPTPMPVPGDTHGPGTGGWPITALCLAVLLVVMDNTIVNVAIPTMSDALNASSTASAVGGGRLHAVLRGAAPARRQTQRPMGKKTDAARRIGGIRRGLRSYGLLLLWQLVTLRVVLGVCAALIYPATLSSIIVIFEGSRYRSLAVGLWAATSGVGIALADHRRRPAGALCVEFHFLGVLRHRRGGAGLHRGGGARGTGVPFREVRFPRHRVIGGRRGPAGVGDHRTPDLRLALLAGHRRHLRGP